MAFWLPHLLGMGQEMSKLARSIRLVGSRLQRATVSAILLLPAAFGVAQAQQPDAAPPVIGGETLLRGDFAKAEAAFTAELDAPGLTNDKRAGLLNDRGVARWHLGELSQSIDDFNKAATIFPELASVYNNRGNVLLAMQSWAEARRDFDRAVLLAPSYAAAYNNRAIAEILLEQQDAAIADFSKAAELAPNSPAPINGRGKIHLDLARPYLALRDFSRAIAIEPSYRPGYRNRALARVSLRQYSVAIDDLNNALAIAPNDQGLLLTRGTTQIITQNYGGALADLDKLVGLAPNSPTAYAERGHVRALMGSFPEAMTDFAKAIEFDPKNRDAFIYRAETHLLSNEFDLGLPDTERALKIDQKHAAAYSVRARLEEALGQKPEAADDFQRAAALDPDEPLNWAGVKRLTGKDRPLPELAARTQIKNWNLVRDGGRLKARNDKWPNTLLPLELYATDNPQLTGWEEKGAPFQGLGVLRYIAGNLAGKSGPQEVELGEVVDLQHGQVIGIEPIRYGESQAAWDWTSGGVLVVKGPDGVTSTLRLSEPQPVVAVRSPSSGTSQSSYQPPVRHIAAAAAAPPPRKQKVFSLFDLLFN